MSIIIQQQLAKVAEEIEEIVWMNDVDYIEACILYCEQKDLEVEYVGEIIQKHLVLRSKIQQEAERLHNLKKTDRLPLLEL